MGCCCAKDQTITYDSEDYIRTFDTGNTVTPYYIMPDGKRKNVVQYSYSGMLPASY